MDLKKNVSYLIKSSLLNNLEILVEKLLKILQRDTFLWTWKIFNIFDTCDLIILMIIRRAERDIFKHAVHAMTLKFVKYNVKRLQNHIKNR